jgi:hypothetical protein
MAWQADMCASLAGIVGHSLYLELRRGIGESSASAAGLSGCMFPLLTPNSIAPSGVGLYSEERMREVIMMTACLADLDAPALAQLLFTCPVQPSDDPTPTEIRMALAAQFRRCGGDLITGQATIAQEAGDHPDSYVARIRWAIQSVDRAYAGRRGREADSALESPVHRSVSFPRTGHPVI